jgi:hypothetical protein
MTTQTTTTAPQDVIVSHSHIPGSAEPWRWHSARIDPVDPRFRARGGFRDCESAANDATEHGHRVVEVRE